MFSSAHRLSGSYQVSPVQTCCACRGMQLSSTFSPLAPRAGLGFSGLGHPWVPVCHFPQIVPLSWPMASATAAAQLPLFIVSVRSCLLVLSAATLRLKPAKPANSPRRTKCSDTLTPSPFQHRSSPYLRPHSLFLKGGSRNCSKIGQLFIGLGELWGHHKPSVSWW